MSGMKVLDKLQGGVAVQACNDALDRQACNDQSKSHFLLRSMHPTLPNSRSSPSNRHSALDAESPSTTKIAGQARNDEDGEA